MPVRKSLDTSTGVLSIREAADVLGVSDKTIRRAIWAGDLPAYRHGKIIRINRRDLEHAFKAVTPLAAHVAEAGE